MLSAMKYLFFFFYRHKKRTTALAVVWTMLILVACLLPGRDIPEVHVPMADKWVHFAIFGGFSFLWCCTLRKAGPRAGLVVFLASVLLGYGVELLQGSGITQGRSFELYDLLADSIGGLLGLLLFYLLRRRFAAST